MKKLLLIILILQALMADNRDIFKSSKTVVNGNEYRVNNFGNYYALLIYVEDYKNLKVLQTPKKDVEDIAKILKNRYGFNTPKIIRNPKDRDELIEILDNYRNKLTSSDNLLIYYAGHGSKNGYWQLSNAKRKSRVGWVSITEAINKTLHDMSSKHILVIADSCYSGYLTRDGITLDNLNKNDKNYYTKLNSLKSRNVLTSGSLQPVLDKDPTSPEHSVFANAFLKILKNNNKAIFSLEEKYPTIKRLVELKTRDQTPLYGAVRETKHQDGGDFIFIDYQKIGKIPTQKKEMKKEKIENSSIQNIKNENKNLETNTVCSNLNNKECLKLGLKYTKNEEYKKSKEIFNKLCKIDNYANGCGELGRLYYYGKGVNKDKLKARKLFISACNKGSARFCRNVGIMYLYGTKPLSKDIKKAKEILKFSCNKNDSISCRKLGDIYANLENSWSKGKTYYKKACKLKDQKSCNKIKEKLASSKKKVKTNKKKESNNPYQAYENAEYQKENISDYDVFILENY